MASAASSRRTSSPGMRLGEALNLTDGDVAERRVGGKAKPLRVVTVRQSKPGKHALLLLDQAGWLHQITADECRNYIRHARHASPRT